MSIEITMPALSPTMSEGRLSKWLISSGDTVSSGDVIAEIETDKATMEVEAADDGIVGELVIAEGTDNVAVRAVIAVLLRVRSLVRFLTSSQGPPERLPPETTP